jgi:hypothetical protein
MLLAGRGDAQSRSVFLRDGFSKGYDSSPAKPVIIGRFATVWLPIRQGNAAVVVYNEPLEMSKSSVV